MCVVMVARKGMRIPYTHLRTANTNNPHGWGIAFRNRHGIIQVVRGFSSNSLVAAYRKCADANGFLKYDTVVHCRIGTTGRNDLDNTHPFEITSNLFLFHNGTFRDIKLTTKGRSDTWHLAQMLRPVFEANPDLLEDEKFIDRMTTYCRSGYMNKLIFMDATDTVIVNEAAGVWCNGIWYSNQTAFPAPRTKFRRLAPKVKHHVPLHNATPRKSVQLRLLEEDREMLMNQLDDWSLESAYENLAMEKEAVESARWEAYVEEKYGHKATRLG